MPTPKLLLTSGYMELALLLFYPFLQDVLEGVKDMGASPSSSSSSTPDSMQKDNPEQDVFLKANFVSLSAEKVDHFFGQLQDQATLALARRVSISARFFSKSLR